MGTLRPPTTVPQDTTQPQPPRPHRPRPVPCPLCSRTTDRHGEPSVATGDPSAVLLQYGAIGAFVVVLGVFAWRAYRRESDRADRLETQLLEANQRIIDRFAEVLTQTRDALRESNDYLRDMARRRS